MRDRRVTNKPACPTCFWLGRVADVPYTYYFDNPGQLRIWLAGGDDRFAWRVHVDEVTEVRAQLVEAAVA